MSFNFPNNPSLNDTHTVGNKTWVYTGVGWKLQTNLSETVANVVANTVSTSTTIISAFDTANAAFIQANSSYTHANSSYIHANAAFDAANNAVDTWVRDAANSASSYANSAFIQANASFDVANTNATTISFAYNHANAAFDTANLGSGGAITVSTFNTTANGLVDTFDIGFNPQTSENIIVSIDGVVQPESTYSVDNVANTITFTTTPVDGEAIRVLNLYTQVTPFVINDNSVTTVKLVNGVITPEKLATSTNTFITTTAEGSAIALAIALG